MVLYIFQAEDCNGKRRIRQFPLSTLGSPLKYVILQIQICFAHLSENPKLDPLEGEGATEGLSRCHCRQKGRWRRWLMTWLTNAGHDSRHQPVNCAGLGVSIHPSHNLIPPRQSLTSRAPARISDRPQLLRLKLLKSNHILQSSCVHKSR